MQRLAIPPEKLIEVASKLRIKQHDTGMQDMWNLNQEQKTLLGDLFNNHMVYVLKVRQIGASTLVGFWWVMWAAVNDTTGHKVRVGVVVDTEAKTKERISICLDFCNQLGIDVEFDKGNLTIRFPNGSEIMGMTAGGRRAGASMTFDAFWITELPFWRDPSGSYTSLMQALVLGGRVVIETTMGIDDPTGVDLWKKRNAYLKRFFSFEEHAEYRMPYDPEILDEEWEIRLRNDGFTSRESMTYWLYKLWNSCGGDIVKCYREYPQKPEHSWLYAEGRFITQSPPVLDPANTLRVYIQEGLAQVEIFKMPSEGSGQYVIGVDTAAGKGRDASAVAVIDKSDHTLMAAYCSDRVMIDDLVDIAEEAQRYYTTARKDETELSGFHTEIPMLVIESNGIGEGVVQAAERRNLLHTPKPMNKPDRYAGLLHVKRFVEAGTLLGPQRLSDECDKLTFENGRFKGPKDLCMAIGFCYHWLESNPYRPPVPGRDFERAQLMRRIRRMQATSGATKGWGRASSRNYNTSY